MLLCTIAPKHRSRAVSQECRGYGSCRGAQKVAPAPATVIESAEVVISGSCRGAPNLEAEPWTSMTRFPGNAWPSASPGPAGSPPQPVPGAAGPRLPGRSASSRGFLRCQALGVVDVAGLSRVSGAQCPPRGRRGRCRSTRRGEIPAGCGSETAGWLPAQLRPGIPAAGAQPSPCFRRPLRLLSGLLARTRASVARFVAPQAFSAALRILPWASISSASAWSSRASWKISSMRFVLVVMVSFYSGRFSPARMALLGPFPGGYDLRAFWA